MSSGRFANPPLAFSNSPAYPRNDRIGRSFEASMPMGYQRRTSSRESISGLLTDRVTDGDTLGQPRIRSAIVSSLRERLHHSLHHNRQLVAARTRTAPRGAIRSPRTLMRIVHPSQPSADSFSKRRIPSPVAASYTCLPLPSRSVGLAPRSSRRLTMPTCCWSASGEPAPPRPVG